MRIFTKKAFEFKNADGERVVTRPLDFAEVPAWVVSDPIFDWGVKDGDITVAESSKEDKAAKDKTAEDKAAAAEATDETKKKTAKKEDK